MSTDNWSLCPKCLALERKAYESAAQAFKDDYGKIPAEEYEKCRQALEKQKGALENKENYTLREDYEVTITEEGVFFVSYRGQCQTCDFRHEYSYNKQVLEC